MVDVENIGPRVKLQTYIGQRFKGYKLLMKRTFAAIQNNHKPNTIKEFDFLRWITMRSFTFFYYFIYETRFKSKDMKNNFPLQVLMKKT